MNRGNQFGLKPGDRVAMSENGSTISNSGWVNATKIHKATIVGFDSYGYPIAFLDEAHKSSLPSLDAVIKQGAKIENVAAQWAKQHGESGRCVSLYADVAFKLLDASDNVVRKEVNPISFGLVPGDTVEVSVDAYSGKLCDGGWGAGRKVKGTIIGSQETGAPLVMLEDIPENASLGWPLGNVVDDRGIPRVESTIAKSLRAKLQADPKFRERRCHYVYSESAFKKTNLQEDEMTATKKNFDLDFGDRVQLSFDSDGIDYEYNPAGEKIEGTIIGFRKDDGTPIVIFDVENSESGWSIGECLRATKDGGFVGAPNFSFDPVLLKEHLHTRGQDYAYYIGNAEAFQKKTKKKGKGKSMASDDKYDAKSETTGAGNKVLARLKKSAAKTPYRVARMQAVTNGKNAVLNAFKDRLDPNSFAMLEGFLSSDAGQGALLGLIGLVGPMIPKVGEDHRVQALCEEFLDEGVAKGTNEVMNVAMAILAPALMSAVAALPPVAEAVEERAAKKKKTRVADEAPASNEEEEEIEEEEEEEATSSKRRSA